MGLAATRVDQAGEAGVEVVAAQAGQYDALIQPYSGHASRQSLEIYSRLVRTDAQASYDQAIGRVPV